MRFYVVCGAHWVCWLCSAGKEISQEEGDCRLSPSSTMLLELVLVGCLFCVCLFGELCENEICLATYEVGGVGFSLIEEGV